MSPDIEAVHGNWAYGNWSRRERPRTMNTNIVLASVRPGIAFPPLNEMLKLKQMCVGLAKVSKTNQFTCVLVVNEVLLDVHFIHN